MSRALNLADFRSSALGEAWNAINAEGGVVPEGDDYSRGFADAITRALEILEDLGAIEPMQFTLFPDDQRAA